MKQIYLAGKANALVVGLGIGSMYRRILLENGVTFGRVDTVDPNVSSATYKSIEECRGNKYDMVVIATPNYLHESCARTAARLNLTNLIVVDKPGFESHSAWKRFKEDYPNIRLQMVKNNLFRQEITKWKNIPYDYLEISWCNKNRIPKPGSWFTDKKRAFGGVSRDLIPHLLHIYAAVNGFEPIEWCEKYQSKTLDNIDSTDYGEVEKDGIYDVDDFCHIGFLNGEVVADWCSGKKDKIEIAFCKNSGIVSVKIIENLGLCPEYAYDRMFKKFLYMTENEHKNYELLDDWVYITLEETTK